MSYLDSVRRIVTVNGNNDREILLNNANNIFSANFAHSPDYKVGAIDSIKNIGFLIQQSTNPLTESKEERTLLCLQSTAIHRGSIVNYTEDNETNNWIVISDIDYNGIYKSTKIHKCNNVITFLDSIGTIKTLPIVLSNQTLYSNGVQEGKFVTVVDNQRSVLVAYNNDSKVFYQGQRFIFNHNSFYKLTDIDDYTYFTVKDGEIPTNGVLKLTMTSDAEDTVNDDRVNNLAYNESQTVTPTPSTSGYSITITGSDTVTENTSEQYTTTIYQDGVVVTDKTVVWSLLNSDGSGVLDASIGTLATNGNSCTVNGISSVYYGELKAVLSDDANVSILKNLSFIGGW